MNLILLLTALFSALTGVGGSVRRPEVAQAVAQVATFETAKAVPAAVVRPFSVLPSLAQAAVATSSPRPSKARGVPLWTARRRE